MIKLSIADRRRWKSAIKNFNKVRNAYARSHKNSKYYLPPIISVEDTLKTTYSSRAEFNRELKRLERATRKGAFDVVITKGGEVSTKWELKEASNLRRSVLAKRKALEKKVDKTTKDKERAEKRKKYLRESIGISSLNLKELKFGELNRFIKSLTLANDDIEKLWIKDAQYKANYLNALNELNLPKNDELYQIVESLSAEEVATAQYVDRFLDIDQPYFVEEIEDLRDKLLSHWKRYAGK